jgi:hypothetical protein
MAKKQWRSGLIEVGRIYEAAEDVVNDKDGYDLGGSYVDAAS